MAIKRIRSPLPGTFYRRPAPEEPSYKDEGDAVAVDDVIGLIEVMKSFHEVKSDADGTIIAFLIENDDAIMAGQPIAEVQE